MEIDAVYGGKGKTGKHTKGKNGKDKGKGKHKGKHENSPKFEGYCGGHKQKDCRYKNINAEVDEEESVEPPNSCASSSTQSGWLCELVVGSDDAQMREGGVCRASGWAEEQPSMSVGLTTSHTLR